MCKERYAKLPQGDTPTVSARSAWAECIPEARLTSDEADEAGEKRARDGFRSGPHEGCPFIKNGGDGPVDSTELMMKHLRSKHGI